MVFLQDTDATNGATVVAPGSHRWAADGFLTEGQVDDWVSLEKTAAGAGFAVSRDATRIRKGGVLFFDGAVLHATGAFPGAARTASDYRYAVVFHFATQKASHNWHRTAMGAAYLRGRHRLELEVEVEGARETLLFHPADDADALAAAFVRRRGLGLEAAARLAEPLRSAQRRCVAGGAGCPRIT